VVANIFLKFGRSGEKKELGRRGIKGNRRKGRTRKEKMTLFTCK